jgi:hypothetical protein
MALPINTSVDGVTKTPGYAPISFLFNAAALIAGLLKPPDRVRLDVITVDATMQETHAAEAEVTEHPVEQGANITDYIRPKLKRYTIDGIISNTPIGPNGDIIDAAQTGALALGITLPSGDILRGTEVNRAKATFKKLQDIVDASQTITIHTPLRDYPSMAIESVTVVRDAEMSRGGIRFQAVCKEIRTVAALKTTTSSLPDSAQPANDMGTQNPPAASDKVKTPAVSAIKSFTNSIGWTRPRGG